jgi:hypothetical protein
MTADESLVQVYAATYAWLNASVQPGDCAGAAEVVERHRTDGCIPYHVEHGSRQEREAILRTLTAVRFNFCRC